MEYGLLYREYETEDGTSSFLQLCLPHELVSQVLQLLQDSPDFWTLWGAKDIGESTSTLLLILLLLLLLLKTIAGVVRNVANEMHQASYREHVWEPVQVDTQWNG